MQSGPPRHPFREFLRTPAGRSLLLAFGIGVTFGAFDIDILLAIPAILVVGLWVPIVAGLKRPRYLALSALAILLIVAPLVSVTYTDEILLPVGSSHSAAAGVDWSVTVGSTTVHSSSSSITVELPSGSATYNISGAPGYAVHPRTGTVSVGSAAVSVPVTFSPVAYAVTFSATGLPASTAWSVSIDGNDYRSTAGTIAVDLSNGTYPYSLGSVPKETPPTESGLVTVAGAPVAVAVPFARSAYPVTFSESALADGTRWNVTAEGVTVGTRAASLVLALPNGSIPYSVATTSAYTPPASASVTVAGAAMSVPLAFVPVSYAVTFTESQLTTGSAWSVSVGGTVTRSTTTTAVVDLVNGTYTFHASGPSGTRPLSGNGTITVAGAPAGTTVPFATSSVVATFAVSGLVAHPPWTLLIGGMTISSTTSAVAVNLSSGSYPYSFGPVAGYTPPAGGSLSVGTKAVNTTGAYLPVRYPVTFTESHLPSGTAWNVSVNGVVRASVGAHVELNLTNGTYNYLVGEPSGRTAIATNATLVVAGAAVTIAVPFAATAYAVTFSESGLASGAATELIRDATLTPFHGASSTDFAWTATVYPASLPAGVSAPLWIDLFVSTCPGATSPNGTTYCSSGYPFYEVTDFLCTDPTTLATCEASAPAATGPIPVSFNFTVGSNGIWDWQMGVAVEDLATHTPSYSLLQGDPTYDGIEGPVIGSYAIVFEALLPTVYLETFLYLGAPFYACLLLYMFIKGRERRRNDARDRSAGPIPPTGGSPSTPGPGGAPPAAPPPGPGAGEKTCPNCQAVVYPSETKCWKCGATLGAPPAPPLPSN